MARYAVAVGMSLVLSFVAQAQTNRDTPLSTCGKNVHPDLCRDGKLRQVCISQDHWLWLDNLHAVTKLEALYPGYELLKPVGHCGCLSLLTTCQTESGRDCDAMTAECNRMLDWGGQFCLPNKWGGNDCYGH